MEELFQPFLFLPCQQLFNPHSYPGSRPLFVLPTCMGESNGNKGERGRANRFRQETAEGGVVLLMEQTDTFHKRTAKLGGLFLKRLTSKVPVGPCRVLGNTVWTLQKVERGTVRLVCCFQAALVDKAYVFFFPNLEILRKIIHLIYVYGWLLL